ncbi:MAG: GAF domain-containing protein, partial [Chloroflexi bacterium]|nr:GAF domain-containing protein [Chloroflexota bacterium]
MWNKIRQFYSLPKFNKFDNFRRAKLLHIINNSILLFIIGFALLYSLVVWLLPVYAQAQVLVFIALGATLIINSITNYLLQRKSIVLASHVLSAFTWIILFSFASITGGVDTPSFLLLIPVVLLVGTLVSIRASVLYGIISMVGGLMLVYLEQVGKLPAPIYSISPMIWWMMFMLGVGLTIVFINFALKDVKDVLERVQTSESTYADNNRRLVRRTMQLETAAEVGRSAAQIRDLDTLLLKVTHLISERFGFYHVGVFLLDERKEFAVMREANSAGGQRMLAENHLLRIGKEGMVGHVAESRKPRIALDVGEDAVYFNNPHLGKTRSEIALPLIAGEELLGVLDVQCEEQAAFSQQDIATLQVLADQVALAIQNAFLFDKMQVLLLDLENRVSERTSELEERSILLEAAYQAIQDNQQKLLVSEKMASLGRLTSGIAHEINTPLATVRASLAELFSLVQEYQSSVTDPDITDEDHREIAEDMISTIEIAKTSSKRAAGFIRGIKTQTRNQASNANHMQIFDPIPIVEETLMLLGHTLRKNKCSVDIKYPKKICKLYGPPAKFAKVIPNLLNNAIDPSIAG